MVLNMSFTLIEYTFILISRLSIQKRNINMDCMKSRLLEIKSKIEL